MEFVKVDADPLKWTFTLKSILLNNDIDLELEKCFDLLKKCSYSSQIIQGRERDVLLLNLKIFKTLCYEDTRRRLNLDKLISDLETRQPISPKANSNIQFVIENIPCFFNIYREESAKILKQQPTNQTKSHSVKPKGKLSAGMEKVPRKPRYPNESTLFGWQCDDSYMDPVLVQASLPSYEQVKFHHINKHLGESRIFDDIVQKAGGVFWTWNNNSLEIGTKNTLQEFYEECERLWTIDEVSFQDFKPFIVSRGEFFP